MKKVIFVSLLLTLSVPSMSNTFQEAPGRLRIKVTAEQANIRQNPDIGSSIVLQILEGTILEAEEKIEGWYHVWFKRRDGSFASGYVHESLVAPVAPVESPAVMIKQEAAEAPPVASPKAPIAKTIPPPAPQKTTSGKKFGFSICGGTKFASVGDLNTGAQGLADYYGASAGAIAGEPLAELHMGYLLGAEWTARLAPNLYAVLGAEYLSGRHSSQTEFSGGQDSLFQTNPRIRAIPVKIGLSYYLFPFLYIQGNVHLVFARCEYFYRLETGQIWQEWRGTAKSAGLGAGVAVGGEWEFYSGLSLVGEAGFNFSRISNFKGKGILSNSFNESYSEDGVLYFFQSGAPDHKDYPLVFIREALPAEQGVSEAREARLDFSGMFLKAGLRIKF